MEQGRRSGVKVSEGDPGDPAMEKGEDVLDSRELLPASPMVISPVKIPNLKY
jgi:hypothetical protein